MKSKKTFISIFVYLALLAVIIVAFVGINTFQTSNNYAEALVVKETIDEGTQMTVTAMEKYLETVKVNKDTISTIESYDSNSKTVSNENVISGQYAIGKIPSGTIITTSMFTAQKIDDKHLVGIDLSKFNDAQYVVLNASKEYAPANNFIKGRNLAVGNVNAYTIPMEDGTQKEFYGILVNKALVYNVFKNANNEITNVGVVVEANDAKLLTTMQDKGIIFRYIESENLPVSTWTTTDIDNSFLESLGYEKDIYLSLQGEALSKFNESLFTNNEFGYVPTFKEDLDIYLEGKHSSISIRKFNLEGGIDNFYGECSLSNGYLSYDKTLGLTKITIPSETEYSFTKEGYYEIKTNIPKEDDFVKYHFIIEKNTYERIAITNNLGVKYEEFNDSNNEKVKSFTQINSQVVYYKNYYLTCIPLKEQKYRDTLEFSEILTSMYYFKDATGGSISNKDFTFLLNTDDSIGKLFGVEIENIYLNTNVTKALPLFYKIEKANVGQKSDFSKINITIDENGTTLNLSEAFNGISNSKYYDSDILQIYNYLSNNGMLDNLKNSEDGKTSITSSILKYILNGEIDTTLKDAKTLDLTIVTVDKEEHNITLEFYK